MKRFSLTWSALILCCTTTAFAATEWRNGKTYDFPIYTNSPSGRQLSGQHAPATTPPLTPEQAQKKFVLPPGFEMRLFASEPEVVNPVAMCWDERGRLWVLELYEFPLGAKPGQKGRDRIKILEDTDGDGKADKVTVFADGLDLATGMLLGNGGVYVGQTPHLLFLKDTDGDDKADTREVLMTGFGKDDRHELLNGFTWGPDGWIYMTQGVFTKSQVVGPGQTNAPPVLLTAGVARFHPATKKFEIFAEGTSNPWGVDFDRSGNAFVSACVIEHLFHLSAGGIYDRQAGSEPFPFAYERLHSINDHKHYMAAYAGVQIYQGNQFPAEYRGTILMGNIHDNAVHQDRLTPNGSSFIGSFGQDFIRANDGWFMPVSTQVGPDGAVWIMDWYDKYPCYQNASADPDGVDREYGRIWRAVYVGNQPGKPVASRPEVAMDLAKLTATQLVALLEHPNSWQRRQAQRLLGERRDRSTLPALTKLLTSNAPMEFRLAALLTLHGAGFLDESTLDLAAKDREPALRIWSARLTGERHDSGSAPLKRMLKLANDADPSVRLAVTIAARQFVSGSLTMDTPSTVANDGSLAERVVNELARSSRDGKDPVLPFEIWMAMEPRVAAHPVETVQGFQTDGMDRMPLSSTLLGKTFRRICDLRDAAVLDQSIAVLGQFTEKQSLLIVGALNGLIEAQRGKAVVPSATSVAAILAFSKFSDESVVDRADRLAALWGDQDAVRHLLAAAIDAKASVQRRIEAIQSIKQQKTETVRDALLKLVLAGAPDAVAREAIQALGEMGGDAIADQLLQLWKEFPASVRHVVVESLASRPRWASSLLTAVENKTIAAEDIPITVRRSLDQSRDATVKRRAEEVLGHYRESSADKLKIIAAKRKMVLSGTPDIEKGHEVARKICFLCHKLYGEGADVGPDLTGVGRSALEALLTNVIDPNQIVGRGYENVEVETKDGRTFSGKMIENTEARVRLLIAGPREEVVAKSEVASLHVSELSVMPEGLEQMPDDDFRNLIWYILNPPQDKRPMTPELRKQLQLE